MRVAKAVRELAKSSVPKTARELAKSVMPDAIISKARRFLYPPPGVHWCRVVMNRECDAFVDTHNVSGLTCLEISPVESRWAQRKWARYTAVDYPDYDVCSKPLPGAWDVIIAEQVLEHVRDPQRALDNIFNMLRSGGFTLITTPFLIKFHPYPYDFCRWTADGMREALRRSGFSSVVVNSWGNRECVIADMTDDNAWTFYVPSRHSLRNNPRFPVCVWAFGHKEN